MLHPNKAFFAYTGRMFAIITRRAGLPHFVLGSVVLLSVLSALAQEPSSEDAAAVIRKSVLALGGEERLKALPVLAFRSVGVEDESAEGQGYGPYKASPEHYEETFAVFPAANRLIHEHRTGLGDKTARWRRWIFDPNQRTVIDFFVQGVYRRNVVTENDRVRQARRIPHILLLEALGHPDRLRILNDAETYDGRSHRVISFDLPGEKLNLRLFIDARTYLLSKFDYRMDFPALGDVLIEHQYVRYSRHASLGWAPERYRVRVNGRTALDLKKIEVIDDRQKIDALSDVPTFPASKQSVFKLEDGVAQKMGASGTPWEAAPGVFLLDISSFTVMFVEFKDYLLVAEAPAQHPSILSTPADDQTGSSVLAESFIAKIKEGFPNKPIRYLVPTHFHSDHAGGSRAFAAEGATIVTTAGNQRYFEQMLSSPRSIVPDRLASTGAKGKVESFKGKHTISDGEQTVELIDIGQSPHSDEMIAVYLPKQKALFQGDMFYFDNGARFPPRNRVQIMKFFSRWLKKQDLKVEQIYSVHGRGYATMKDVETVLAEPQ